MPSIAQDPTTIADICSPTAAKITAVPSKIL